ncbi:MazG-like family protein [Natronosalvus halobius]|uniref:MazG-like family protein n=1 Tax=Natronosalvus halobius TaxID=2953746 RepID=UPI0020A013F3|nr:MazG-like family protein [Natronosalvus halobius]USZ71625.1 MazG-like family protein [Natronosalvus halobius]
MDAQDDVAAFLERHDLETDPAYRTLDLTSEVGEVAKELNESTAYGANPETAAIERDELGDALFALLALCTEVGVDAGAALEESLAKYERRLETTGSVGSGT